MQLINLRRSTRMLPWRSPEVCIDAAFVIADIRRHWVSKGLLDLGESDMYGTFDTPLNTNLMPGAGVAPFPLIFIVGSHPNTSRTYAVIPTDCNTEWVMPPPAKGLVAAGKTDMRQ